MAVASRETKRCGFRSRTVRLVSFFLTTLDGGTSHLATENGWVAARLTDLITAYPVLESVTREVCFRWRRWRCAIGMQAAVSGTGRFNVRYNSQPCSSTERTKGIQLGDSRGSLC